MNDQAKNQILNDIRLFADSALTESELVAILEPTCREERTAGTTISKDLFDLWLELEIINAIALERESQLMTEEERRDFRSVVVNVERLLDRNSA